MKQLGFTHESTHNESQEWYTPPTLFDALGLRFDMDVASPGHAAVPWIPAARHLTVVENGLATPWQGRVWLNPPYGPDTPAWVDRFVNYDGEGLMLVFARTDTQWFHAHGVRADALLFLRGRVRFIRGDGYVGGGAGAASMILGKGQTCVNALLRSRLGFFCHTCDTMENQA